MLHVILFRIKTSGTKLTAALETLVSGEEQDKKFRKNCKKVQNGFVAFFSKTFFHLILIIVIRFCVASGAKLSCYGVL